jgi:hypothetical protein
MTLFSCVLGAERPIKHLLFCPFGRYVGVTHVESHTGPEGVRPLLLFSGLFLLASSL